MPDQHADRIRDAFSAQAAAFEDARFNRIFTLDAAWLFERLELREQDLLLDVAAGTGHVARELAPRVRAAVALDATPAMLAAGKAAADEQGLCNVVFQQGDASALAFLGESFDVVLSRFALHHMEDPGRAIAEMARCLRPGGRLALADMVADEDSELAAAQDRVERMRDPSHTSMLAPSRMVALIEQAALVQLATDVREIDRPLEPWLEQAQTGGDVAEALRAEIRAEMAGGPLTGLRPYERDGELRFRQRWASALALKPSA